MTLGLLSMSIRHVQQRIQALPVSEGAGVTVHRTIGTPALRHLDPFLMLDYFGAMTPTSTSPGFRITRIAGLLP